MMKAKWIFDKDMFDDGNTDRMAAHCQSKGIDFQHQKYIPFMFDQYEWKFHDDDCVIVYGGIGMSQYVQRKKLWYPGTWCDFHKLKCSTYLAHWGRFSLQEDYTFIPLNEVKRKWGELWERFNSFGHVFIRPDDCDKRFNGEKVAPEHFDRWWAQSRCYDPAPESLTMVSKPNRILAEWRMIIAERKVVTGSHYKTEGREAYSPLDTGDQIGRDAVTFAETVANSSDFEPAPIYPMDVCLIGDGSFRLIEIGSINCCGLYKCDVGKIVDVASDLALREWRETHELS